MGTTSQFLAKMWFKTKKKKREAISSLSVAIKL